MSQADKLDRRVARTRRSLREALIQLALEKGYDKISMGVSSYVDLRVLPPTPNPVPPQSPRLTGEVSQNEGGGFKIRESAGKLPFPLDGGKGPGMGVSIACPRD